MVSEDNHSQNPEEQPISDMPVNITLLSALRQP